MQHFVSINDKTKTGKSILEIIKTIAVNDKSVSILDNEELNDTISAEEFSLKLKKSVLKKIKN